MEDTNTLKTKIQSVIEEITSSAVELGNYKKYYDRVKTMNDAIDMQIENVLTEYKEQFKKYDTIITRQQFKDMYETGDIVDAKAYDYLKWFNKKYAEVFSLRVIQARMQFVLMEKMYDVMDNIKAYEIKRDALQHMDEDNKRKNELMLQILESNNNFYREKIETQLQIVEERQKIFQEKQINMLNIERQKLYDLLAAFANKVGKTLDISPPPIDFNESYQEMSVEAQRRVDDRKPLELPQKPYNSPSFNTPAVTRPVGRPRSPVSTFDPDSIGAPKRDVDKEIQQIAEDRKAGKLDGLFVGRKKNLVDVEDDEDDTH